MQKILKQKPGVLIGMSTTEPYKGSAIFYDGNKAILEVELSRAMPSVISDYFEPGLDINLFCVHSISVKYPDDADIDFFVD